MSPIVIPTKMRHFTKEKLKININYSSKLKTYLTNKFDISGLPTEEIYRMT